MAGRRVIQDGIEHPFHRPPRKEISQFQSGRERPEGLVDWARLTISLERTFHEIEVCVRYLESYFFEPRGSRQYDICKSASRLIHEQVNADDHLCLAGAIGDLASIRE